MQKQENPYGVQNSAKASIGMQNINDQITQSQSVGLLPMPRSGSRLDTINENQGNLQLGNGQDTIHSLNFGVQKGQSGTESTGIQGRTGLAGRGLGGIGGSIISSSGMNQPFKDFTIGGAVTGPNKMKFDNKAGNSSSTIPIIKPSSITPATNTQFSSMGNNLIKNKMDSPEIFSKKVNGIGSGVVDLGREMSLGASQ